MAPNANLQLFPAPPSKKATRKPSIPRNIAQPASIELERSRSPEAVLDGRKSPIHGRQISQDGRRSALAGRASPAPGPSDQQIAAEIPRSQTSLSEAPTLVRSDSPSPPKKGQPQIQSPRSDPSAIHSIFPRYNPDLPLEQQPYYPTQASPTHIPRTLISKPPYSPSIAEQQTTTTSPQSATFRHPLSAPSTTGHFPRTLSSPPAQAPLPSTSEELKELWKVTNGWRVSESEARSFCLRMTSSADAPIHTLSSSTQPFYTLQLDPTSTSALLTLTRQDPSIKPKTSSSSTGKIDAPRSGVEVLTTTLEDPTRRLPPNDGLVALLYPRAASNMVIDLASKAARSNSPSASTTTDAEMATILAAAEHECGRLVYDTDSLAYYLVHPSSTSPFRILISHSPAWSRTEYVLEHPSLPQNLVRLVRDGAGTGYLEIDTGVAARLDSFYVVDVAVCAILIVCLEEEKTRIVERFDAPPPSALLSPLEKGKERKKKKTPGFAEMEVDLESQDSLGKGKEELPRGTRGCLRLLYWGFRCVFWCLTVGVGCAAKCIIGVSECLTPRALKTPK